MENTTSTNYGVKVKKLPNSMREISASIPAEIFDATRSEAITHLGKDAEIPGFRKGHVPEKMLLARIGDAALLEEMAEIAISRAYPDIVRNENLDVLGRPDVRITKIALGNPLEFTVTTAVFPEITLPDYKKIAAKVGSKKSDAIVVSDDELEKTIMDVRKMHRGGDIKEGEEEKELPPLDDAYVKSLGDFTGVADFKEKLRANMIKEKERTEKDKNRITIIEAILKETDIDLPDIIIDQELRRMEDEFTHDLARMGLNMEGYLTATKKTKEDVTKEWRPEAEKRAKTQLVVAQIAIAEKCEPDPELLKSEVAALRAHYPDATEERAQGYVHMLLTNEKVFQLLEASA